MREQAITNKEEKIKTKNVLLQRKIGVRFGRKLSASFFSRINRTLQPSSTIFLCYFCLVFIVLNFVRDTATKKIEPRFFLVSSFHGFHFPGKITASLLRSANLSRTVTPAVA